MQQYPTTDLPVKDMPAVNAAVTRLLDRWIFPFMGMVYNFKPASFVVQVRPPFPRGATAGPFPVRRSHTVTQDLFIVKYEARGQTHLATHRDGSLLR